MTYRPRLKMMPFAVAHAVGFQHLPRLLLPASEAKIGVPRLAVPWHIVFRVWGARRP